MTGEQIAWMVVILAALAVIVFFIWRPWDRAKVSIDLSRGRIMAEGSKDTTQKAGVEQTQIESGGNVSGINRAGTGVRQDRIKADGDVNATNEPPPGEPPPKA
jgi:hypothetical protein